MKMMFDEKTVAEADAKAALTEEPGVEYGSIDVVNIRLVKEPSIMSNTPIKGDVDAVKVVTEYLSGFDREVFGILHLSSRGTPISFNVASVGTLTESLVSPREIFKTAILSNASSFIAFHCHPSGCPEPSQTDLITTQRLQKAGEIMNIKLIDHIIVGCLNQKKGQNMIAKLIFFDLDGTLSSPEYRRNGKPVIGFSTVDSWIAYCEGAGKNAYQHCKPNQPVKRYAIEQKQNGAELYVLTVVMSEAEIRAKEAFLAEHYEDIFAGMITVWSAGDKAGIIRNMAEEKGVALTDCELVEDTYMTLIDILDDGVKATHMSSIVCNL